MSAPALSARWLASPRNREAEVELQNALKIPSVVAAILVQRGVSDPEKAYEFLNPSLDSLHDARLLPDFHNACKAILGAKERGERIYVHGDYDVDGVTSAAIYQRFLSKIGCQVQAHVPHRMREGYGIHELAVEEAKSVGAKLFLTCDCGTSAHRQIELAREAGMASVVTDHHTVGSELPAANAVVNPHRSDSTYPFAELSGAGVAFKLCDGINRLLGNDPNHFRRAYLDLAALGTIADVMPLIGENRIIAKFGLERLSETKKVGLQALMRAANLDPKLGLSAYHVGFVLGPRLNAAGRIDDAALSLQVLLESDPEVADQVAKKIEAINLQRKAEQTRIFEEAVQMVISDGQSESNVIVVAGANWHSGIVGIVAGKLTEMFRRPSFVLSFDPDSGVCKGSARSILNFHLADAIRSFPNLFLTGGGHALAAGCSFHIDKLAEIRESLDRYADERLTPEDFLPIVRADLEVSLDELNLAAAESLKMLQPFGCENPEPLFLIRDAVIAQITPTRNPEHARFLIKQESLPTVSGMAFGIGERLSASGAGLRANLLVRASVDEYRGQREFKVHLKDYAAVETMPA